MPEEQFQSSSFIPKGVADYQKPTSSQPRGGSYSGDSNLLFNISAILAGVAAVAAAGVFFYTQYLESNLADKKQALSEAQAAFDPEVIEELNEIDTRLNSAGQILDDHTAVTPVFDVVESITVASVQITSLSVTHPDAQMAENVSPEEAANSGPDTVEVSMDGIARDHAAVALQSQAMSENEVVQEAVLTNFGLNEQGNVAFTIEFSLPVEYMSYKNTL